MEIKKSDIKEIPSKKYIFRCPFCEKEITGVSEKQVFYNLGIHVDAKHKGINDGSRK